MKKFNSLFKFIEEYKTMDVEDKNLSIRILFSSIDILNPVETEQPKPAIDVLWTKVDRRKLGKKRGPYKKDAYKDIICPVCGKFFKAYGRRITCSNKCAAAYRSGPNHWKQRLKKEPSDDAILRKGDRIFNFFKK